MKQSKALNQSWKYFLKPMPVSLMIISKEKIRKKTKLKFSKMLLSDYEMGYLSSERIKMFPTMQEVMNHWKILLDEMMKQSLYKQNL